MSEAGLVGDVPITLVTGPEEYLFGEEKALLEVIEVRTRSRACSPYIYGLFTSMPQMGWSAGIDLSSDGVAVPSSNPTLVNNVETLANVVPILGGAPTGTGAWEPPSRPASRSRPSSATCSAGVAEIELGAVGRGHRNRGRRCASRTHDQGRAVGRRQRRDHRDRSRR